MWNNNNKITVQVFQDYFYYWNTSTARYPYFCVSNSFLYMCLEAKTVVYL